eukprot:Pgem_evm1s823
MGNKASTNVQDEKKTVDLRMRELKLRQEAMVNTIMEARGSPQDSINNNSKEIVGGRSIMQYKQLYYSDSQKVSDQIEGAINDFFAAADSGIDGGNKDAQHAAVSGCAKLVESALATIVGNKESETCEEQSYVVLWLNNSFCRVDYYLYQQHICASGTGEGLASFIPEKIQTTARIIVCDISVLDPDQIKPAEMNFLFSNALHIHPADFHKLLQISSSYTGLLMIENLMNDLRQQSNKLSLEDTEKYTKLCDVASEQATKVNELIRNLDANAPAPKTVMTNVMQLETNQNQNQNLQN